MRLTFGIWERQGGAAARRRGGGPRGVRRSRWIQSNTGASDCLEERTELRSVVDGCDALGSRGDQSIEPSKNVVVRVTVRFEVALPFMEAVSASDGLNRVGANMLRYAYINLLRFFLISFLLLPCRSRLVDRGAWIVTAATTAEVGLNGGRRSVGSVGVNVGRTCVSRSSERCLRGSLGQQEKLDGCFAGCS